MAVKRALMKRVSAEITRNAFLDGLHGGFHYIFKYKVRTKDGLKTRLHLEVKYGDVDDCYAEAKMSQLEKFPELSHTGGETIGEVRNMLRSIAGEEEAASFYADFSDDVPVTMIDDDAAIWLRDTYGIAPWHGGLRFPAEISVFANVEEGKESSQTSSETVLHAEFGSSMSGFVYDQEDNFYNTFFTKVVLEALAKVWDRDILYLDFSDLMEYPATSAILRLVNFDEVVGARTEED